MRRDRRVQGVVFSHYLRHLGLHQLLARRAAVLLSDLRRQLRAFGVQRLRLARSQLLGQRIELRPDEVVELPAAAEWAA